MTIALAEGSLFLRDILCMPKGLSLIRQATGYVRSGHYKPQYKYILVDEFQDISAIRASLVKALVDYGNDTCLTCVGDDWQSIYRFSGSDINYTGNFEKHFGYTEKILLDKTFRYNDKINDFSKTFITLDLQVFDPMIMLPAGISK